MRSQNRQMSKQIRTALKYQVIVTLSIAVVIGGFGGVHWALSALLGGLTSLLAGATYAVMLSRVGNGSAEDALLAMLRAEAAKVLVIILLLWLVFASYSQVLGAGFIGTFIVTTLIFSLAIFFRPN